MDSYEQQMADAITLQIRVELAEHSMRQSDLSAAVGIAAGAMSRYLMGHRTFPMHLLIKIARAFGMTLSEFIGKAEARVSSKPVDPVAVGLPAGGQAEARGPERQRR